METAKESFLKRKNIEISAKRYLQDAMSAMALGLFASLLIGVILDTIGVQTANLFGENTVSAFLIEIGGQAKAFMGAAIGIAVAWGLKAPPLVMFASTVTGMMGASMTGFGIDVSGGPAGAFIGPLSTCVFKMTNIPVGAGMGTSGLVGQIGTFTDMGFTLDTLWKVLLLHIVLPAVLSLVIDKLMRKLGLIKEGDYKLDL